MIWLLLNSQNVNIHLDWVGTFLILINWNALEYVHRPFWPMARAKKFEEHNGLKFNSIYTNSVGSVIQTKGSMGFRVVDNDFNHLGFYFDAVIAEEFLDMVEKMLLKEAA